MDAKAQETVRFLASLPEDGANRKLEIRELDIAHRLHQQKLCFMIKGIWPDMLASIAFEGRKVLARSDQ